MSPKRESAADQLTDAEKQAREDIKEGIALLEKVVALEPTMERESMCGSAYKRLAMLAAAEDLEAEAKQAIAKMQQHYAEAEKIGRRDKLEDAFYPMLNRLAAELTLNLGQPGWAGLDATAKAAARAGLQEATSTNPDFWSVVGEVELRMYEAVEAGNLAAALPSIEEAYDDARRRVIADWYWRSVFDQARFTLARYLTIASPSEHRAAEALLKKLEGFAKRA